MRVMSWILQPLKGLQGKALQRSVSTGKGFAEKCFYRERLCREVLLQGKVSAGKCFCRERFLQGKDTAAMRTWCRLAGKS